jgi:hypothetical protein
VAAVLAAVLDSIVLAAPRWVGAPLNRFDLAHLLGSRWEASPTPIWLDDLVLLGS